MHTAIDKEAATFALADSSNMYLQAMPWGEIPAAAHARGADFSETDAHLWMDHEARILA
jgi:hypothetical protein